VVGIIGGVLELPTIVVVVGGLIAAGGALWSAIEREQFEHELRQKSDEIADLNRKIAASVTGGDSFCLLTLGTWDDLPDRALLMVVHQGEHPLYDVTVTIVDVQKFQREVAAGQVALNQPSTTSFPVGNMSPNSSQVLGEHWPLPDADEQDYNVFFNARNGFFTQEIRMRRVSGLWRQAMRVTRTEPGNPLLYEKIAQSSPGINKDKSSGSD
jgi:hypothetical protein